MTMLDSLCFLLSQHWLVILPLLLVIYLLKNYLNHGLYKYPGPALASLTDWWRFFDVLGRRPDLTQIKLHQRHGDIVRLGPNALAFANPSALKSIYGLNQGFVKVTPNLTLDVCAEAYVEPVGILSCTAGHVQWISIANVVLNHRRAVSCNPA